MYKYQMIANTIYNRIQENIYESGEKLPSIRDLAKEFNTSKQTILQAFKTIEQRHLVYSQLKSGYYVVDKKLTISPEQGRTINFTNASPNIINFPYKDFQHCIDRAFDTYQYELFNYNLSKGLDPLVKTIKNY
ncbi:GntR family transcriptional regulator [Facklamia sp. DSM 111018]|uniref:GntR family transcriptional regulator n=1 Tax=Facklamia lactis TaxID=2749967 RepID=A0ABS0LS94_9LACT|nr:GntR family transcriptional regulator [Facklamia lactis]MBG9986206.1 GntR family transcriptional regulator [Facklamia lactis]